MELPRVVITGLGVVSGFGIGKEIFWQSLMSSRRAVAPITAYDVSDLPVKQAAMVPAFELAAVLPEIKNDRGLTPGNKFVLATAKLALADAGLPVGEREDVGIVLTTLFGTHFLHPRDAEALLGLPSFFVNSLPNMPAGYVSVTFGLQGAHVALASGGEACGLNALIYACDLIRAGSATALLVGGYEVLSYGLLYGLCATGRLAHEGQVTVPFDRRRAGPAAGEGCGLLLLESYERARQRGATIHAEVKGNAAVQIRGEMPRGINAAAGRALSAAGLKANQLGAIVANAAGDPAGDQIEADGLALALGKALTTTPITAPKAALGEAYAASGVFGAIISALAIAESRLPPIAGCDEPDPGCHLSALVRNQPTSIDGPVLMSACSPQTALAAIMGKP